MSCSPAARRSTNPSVTCTRTSTRSRAASTSRTSRARATRRRSRRPGSDPGPRLGFFGVIDERLDIDLVAGVAAARPDWQFVLIGPVVKIDPANAAARRQYPLPRRQGLRGAARVHRRLGRRAAAVRAQRSDPLHQPDQDAGVPRRRASPSSRPRFATSCAPTASTGSRASPTRLPTSSPLSRPRSPTTPSAAASRRGCVARADVVGDTWAAMSDLVEEAVAARRSSAPSHPPTPASTARRPPRERGEGQSMFDYLVVGAGFAGSRARRTAGAGSRQAGADRRQAPAHRRQRL